MDRPRDDLRYRFSDIFRISWFVDLGAGRDAGADCFLAEAPEHPLKVESSCRIRKQKRLAAAAMALAALSFSAPLAAKTPEQEAKVEYATRCIAPAAEFHKVNAWVLKGILKVESAFNAGAINRNQNGSTDVGIGQMNSIHFKELYGYGIAPNDLLDPCVGTYVAAWHLAKQLKVYGNTWFAIGAYHSATPYFNARYQALVYNALISMGVVSGARLSVAPLNVGPTSSRRAAIRKVSPSQASAILATLE
ncbi:Lytic transglycosylase, catalytic (plasmid) [Rhodoferax ferrireducens T118]|uniref:Lytic transglycosylase, catalytic n=2 Tax=Rhodoferax ferrireducens TaxID=192843 RepID=Q21PX2_ALBFT|nr:Lytic transglycosylase, catalytic [Rhodoferax ferrireducens T118]